MNRYPNKSRVVEALLAVARDAALESPADHPEDIAMTMTSAIESAAAALMVWHRQKTGEQS